LQPDDLKGISATSEESIHAVFALQPRSKMLFNNWSVILHAIAAGPREIARHGLYVIFISSGVAMALDLNSGLNLHQPAAGEKPTA
jgi:hypothetical protein